MRQPATIRSTLFAGIAVLATPFAYAADDRAGTWRFADAWPTHHVFADGSDLGLSLKYQYDVDRFGADGGRLQDAQTFRRRELGVYLKKKDVYEMVVVYDLQARSWSDTYLSVHSRALLGIDAGAFRVGYSKTPVGFEGNTSTGATTFLEAALPVDAIYAGRRLGVDWTYERPHLLGQAGYYTGGDLNGGNDGRMVAGRVAWVPLDEDGRVLHLAVSGSREWPSGSTDGRGLHTPPAVRLRARPEAGLAGRLLDSGTLAPADHLDRRGLEALWIRGPWSVQGEYLRATVSAHARQADYRAHGYYALVSWVVTGESRSYAGGNVGNVKPRGRLGALELAVRYSELDLDHAGIAGGRERDWTLGATWYINRYLKLQANYVRARSDRGDVHMNPQIIELRAQVQF